MPRTKIPAMRLKATRPIPDGQAARPMSNLLTPAGLVPRHLYLSCASHPEAIDARTDPMPDRPGVVIQTEKGVRGLKVDECCRGLGVPTSNSTELKRSIAKRTTSVFHWEYLAPSLAGFPSIVLEPNRVGLTTVSPALLSSDAYESDATSVEPPFDWKPPDLREGGKWFVERIRNLKAACRGRTDEEEVYRDGLDRLRRHRQNYNSEGPAPKWLQLLWREYAPEHWEQLRNGFEQNFLSEPPAALTPNANMDESGFNATAEFVDELIKLGVVRDIDEGMEILANAPLFVIPKEGQPGEWRVIADMLKGGQNAHIGADPCFLPRVGHICCNNNTPTDLLMILR